MDRLFLGEEMLFSRIFAIQMINFETLEPMLLH